MTKQTKETGKRSNKVHFSKNISALRAPHIADIDLFNFLLGNLKTKSLEISANLEILAKIGQKYSLKRSREQKNFVLTSLGQKSSICQKFSSGASSHDIFRNKFWGNLSQKVVFSVEKMVNQDWFTNFPLKIRLFGWIFPKTYFRKMIEISCEEARRKFLTNRRFLNSRGQNEFFLFAGPFNRGFLAYFC